MGANGFMIRFYVVMVYLIISSRGLPSVILYHIINAMHDKRISTFCQICCFAMVILSRSIRHGMHERDSYCFMCSLLKTESTNLRKACYRSGKDLCLYIGTRQLRVDFLAEHSQEGRKVPSGFLVSQMSCRL